METRRVVITGLGTVTPLGLDVPTAWQGLISGRSGIIRIEEMPAELKGAWPGNAVEDTPVKIFGFAKGFNPTNYMDGKSAQRMDRFAQFAVAAAGEAIRDAGLEGLIKAGPALRQETGVIIGTGTGGQITNEEQYATWKEKGSRRVSAFAVPRIMPNAGSGNVALFYGLQGPALSVVSACATGLDSIIIAYKAVRDGDATVMLAGGSEAAITPMVVSGFANMRALTKDYNNAPQKGSRPFDRDRSGFVMSEGAAVLVLECLDHALSRGAAVYGEIIGYCQNNDANHITEPDPVNQALAIKKALMRAGVRPEEVDYINAHGTSTPLNDGSETEAIKSALGQHAHKVLISSTKSMTGHLAGAAGALEAAICALVLRHGIVPPTINLDNPDVGNGCDLKYVPHKAVTADVNVVVKNSFGFGGHNTVVVLQKYQK